VKLKIWKFGNLEIWKFRKAGSHCRAFVRKRPVAAQAATKNAANVNRRETNNAPPGG
jgi:hypothetical protein